MHKKRISELAAKAIIFLAFTVTLLICILYWWSAEVITDTQKNVDMAAQIEAFQLRKELEMYKAQELELSGQLEDLQGQLNTLQTDNQRWDNATMEIENSLSLAYQGEFKITAYCCEEYPHICGGNGVTASGTKPTPGTTIAADWSILPAGTWVYIEGIGLRRVEDTGSAIKGNRIDVAVDTHDNALRFPGQGNHHVWVLGFGSRQN